MASENLDNELVVQQDGPVVQVTLNRPDALNALSFEMIRILAAGLGSWADDEGVKAVFVHGAGDKAFCAGGDVKATYKTGMAFRRGGGNEDVISLFYGEEYQMNRQLFRFPKPIFAFMDGITMGGGYGVAGPCTYRIASEKTVFAMPEVAIGFFPDVGSVYFLNRCPGELGTYLALTGSSIGAADMLYCGLASHYVPSAKHHSCMSAVVGALETGEGDIETVLAGFVEQPKPEGILQSKQSLIDRCFAGNDVPAIISALRESGDDWALAQADIISSRSPTSLKVSLAHLRRAADMDFDQVMAQDFTLAKHFMRGHDFYEGVRALLVDKDKQPKWEPKTLDSVTGEAVEGYFKSVGADLDEIIA